LTLGSDLEGDCQGGWFTLLIEQVAWNKSRLLLRNILQNTKTLQRVIIYKSYLKCQAEKVESSDILIKKGAERKR